MAVVLPVLVILLLGRQTKADPWGWLASEPTQLGERHDSETLSLKLRWKAPEA